MKREPSYKRCFDIVFSVAALIFSFPLFLLITIGIRLSSPGKALYTQKRLGKNGNVFYCLKFRTMHLNADRCLEEVLFANPQLQKEWREKQKLTNDPRVFPFGKFLRRTSLDELPQFFNVIKGELSVVGPRPYMVSQKSELGPQAFKILSIRPGITGLWQTSGRSTTTFRERISLDAQYVDKKSFWLDILLIMKTIPSILFPKDAY